MSSPDDRRGGSQQEGNLERLIKQVFEDQLKYDETISEDDRAAVISLFGLLMNRSKIIKQQGVLGAPPSFIQAYEEVTIVLSSRPMIEASSL